MEHSLNKPKKHLAIVVSIIMIFGMLTLFYPSISSAFSRPFGGAISTIFTGCVNGYVVTVGFPSGGTFMYIPGTLSYSYGPPSHPSQWLLGSTAGPTTCYVPCTFGLCPWGVFETILFHGSSY